KCVEHKVGAVALERGAPCEHDGVGRVEYPDEHERAFRPEPTDKAEAENPHQYTDHFDFFNVTDDECIHAGMLMQTCVPGEQILSTSSQLFTKFRARLRHVRRVENRRDDETRFAPAVRTLPRFSRWMPPMA